MGGWLANVTLPATNHVEVDRQVANVTKSQHPHDIFPNHTHQTVKWLTQKTNRSEEQTLIDSDGSVRIVE
jgi:hypothetical protein